MNIKLELNINTVNKILVALSKQPYEAVFAEIADIQRQSQEQMKPQAVPDAAPAEAPSA